MTLHPNYIGCDISKHHLDFHDPSTRRSWRIDNSEVAIAALAGTLDDSSVFIVMEATGGYDRLLRYGLAERRVRFCRVNPTMARRFAQARGRRAKTDALDAAMLAELGRLFQPAAEPDPCETRDRLTALARRRDQLVAMRAVEKTRLQEAGDADIAACIRDLIAHLTTKVTQAEAAIATLIKEDNRLKGEWRLLTSAPGIGPVAATTLLALMPELGTASPKRIAALAGLAPYNHDSGMLKGKRCIAGGRRRVRKALYMAALSAIRTCSRMNDFYKRIAERAAAKKIAVIAVARKLLTCLNAMLRDRKSWA